MSRNGSGTYTPPASSWSPAVNGATATFADWNALLTDLSAALTQSVSKDGQTAMTGNLPMGGFVLTGLGAGAATGQSVRWQQLFSQGVQVDIASASTVDIGAENTNFLNITGTTTITSLGTNYNGPRFLRFDGALTLTHNSTTLILPGATNITTAAGDTCVFIPNASTSGTPDGWIMMAYQRGDGGATFVGPVKLYGGTTLGDASGDALLINSTAASLGGNLNVDSGTLFIDASNNRVGIGTAAPEVRLGVNGSLYVNTGAMIVNRANATAATTDGVVQFRIDGAASSYVGTPASGAIAFYNASAIEQMRMSATAGALQLNLTSTPIAKLEMNNSSLDAIHCADFKTDGTSVFRVEVDGDVKNTNNSYGAISDAKLKENIADASPKLDKLRQIKVRTFNLIGSDLKQIGVVAQELREVFPSLVDEDSDGTLSVKYSVLVPILVKAVQELADKLEAK